MKKPRNKSRNRKRPPTKRPSKGWNPVADWYDGMVGDEGSKYHQHTAIPTVLEMLELKKGDEILDLGSGQGVLAKYIVDKGGIYTGVETSKKLVMSAQRRHGNVGTFLCGDVCKLEKIPQLRDKGFDAAVFMLSIQDIRYHETAISSATRLLKPQGKLILFLTHPAFRVPRQSGWGYDEGRKLVYRRIDRYLTPLDVPLKVHPKSRKVLTRSYHRPISSYVNALTKTGLLVDDFRELPTYQVTTRNAFSKAEKLAREEIPLFLAIRGRCER